MRLLFVFVVGLLAGGLLGVTVTCLMVTTRQADEAMEQALRKSKS